ncbi:tetratricopeptide repeat protein [Ruegeria arenilitoris]|uniref:tetratricopeptide repeat protein n=1 Tax=Ruegeria arenilitoris TaxID=1173585 RepID=UPI001CFEB97A|nr:tetratricopeptide repeat protein [Ruegeria arenilitoris]
MLLSFNSPSRLEAKYTQLTATCLGNNGSMATVVSACTALIEVNGLTPDQRNELMKARGWAYYCGRRYAEAISNYDAALALRPNDATSHLRRGMGLDAQGNFDAAETEYAKTLQIDPNNINALLEKSKIDEKHGRLEDAAQGHKRVLEIKPDSSKSGYAVARLLNRIDGKDGVKAFLDQASTRWPEQAWVHNVRVYYHLGYTGDLSRALEAVSEVDRLTSDVEGVLLMQATIHLTIGEEEQGIEYVQRLAAYMNESDEHLKGIFIKRWFYAAINWHLWKDKREALWRGHLFAVMGRPELATPELESALPTLAYKGRKAVLDMFSKRGVSVAPQAYAGSTKHLNEAVADYVIQAGKLLENLSFRSENATSGN